MDKPKNGDGRGPGADGHQRVGAKGGAGGAIHFRRMLELPACGCFAEAGKWKPDQWGAVGRGHQRACDLLEPAGWSDPFSSPVYTERQNAYSERFHLEGVYTPQMVINGAEQIVGSDRAALLHAVEKEDAESPRMSLRIVSLSVAGGHLTVNLSTSGELPAHGADLIAVLADDSDRSSVLHGENSGRTLAHVAVARSITRVARVQAAGELTVQIPIPASMQTTQGHHLILFAQTPGNGRVLGTDTKPL